MKTLIIAEAGVNHNGSLDMALALVDAAHQAGADVVKFQTFKAANLVTQDASKAQYQQQNDTSSNTQLEMLQRLELSHEHHNQLLAHCQKVGIEFLSTAFDHESLGFLLEQMPLKRLKVPSGEITNAPLLLAHARSGLPLIVSTGMANLADIEQALGVIAFGLTADADAIPSVAAFQQAYTSAAGQKALKDNVSLLHCTSEYPAPLSAINLRAMDVMASAFGLPVGYSDHSQGITVATAAVARGACVIEKHFTLDKTLPGPDHIASLEPDELAAMVQGIRDTESALGVALKSPSEVEFKNMDIIRKSLVATKPIAKGECFTRDNLGIKRPGGGQSPVLFWQTLGSAAEKDYEQDELI